MRMIAAAIALSLAGSAGALAEETTIIHRESPGAVIEHRGAVVERRSVESTGAVGGCSSKTVTKTNDEGNSKTVRKESCD